MIVGGCIRQLMGLNIELKNYGKKGRMYDKEYYKKWYQKNKEKQKIWQHEYYQKYKEHILEMHKDWAKKNVDHTGSVWRLYGRRRRNKNPNIDKEYRLRKKFKECIGLYPITSQLKLLK